MDGETEAQRLAGTGKCSSIRVMGEKKKTVKTKQEEAVSHLHGPKGKERRERAGGVLEHPTPPPHHTATKNRHWVGYCRLFRRNAVFQAPGKDGSHGPASTVIPHPASRRPAQHHDPLPGTTAEPTPDWGAAELAKEERTKQNPKTNHPIKKFNSTDHTRYLTPSNCN